MTAVDESAANRLRQAAHVAEDHGDRTVKCDVRDLFEVTAEAVGGRTCQRERDALREALEDIERWSRAYPLKVFPEPDFKYAAEVLKAHGLTIDAISASAMRHAVEGVGDIARRALANSEES